MAIDKTSRYAKVDVLVTTDAAGEEVRALELRTIPKTTGVFHHTPTGDERLDHIAHRYLRDPKKFWRICDASDVLDPFDVVVPGRPVLIPPQK
jgi:hypothetical protein